MFLHVNFNLCYFVKNNKVVATGYEFHFWLKKSARYLDNDNKVYLTVENIIE